MKIIIPDLETSGLPLKNTRYDVDFMTYPSILSIAWKIIVDGIETPVFEYIVNQKGGIVPASATAINGITQEMCDNSKFDTFTTLLQFMMDSDGADLIVGWNIYFDTSIMKANVLRIIQGGKTPMDMYEKITEILHKDKRIDLMRVCARLWGGKWPTLSDAYTRLFGERFNAHSAGEDVKAVSRIFKELILLNVIKLPDPVVKVEEEY